MHSMLVFDPGFETNFDFPSKTPMFSTIVQKPVSGRGEIRASLQPYPLWKIEYEMNFGRGSEAQDQANSVYQYVLGFFMNMGGQFSDFLYEDPNDNTVDLAQFGIGDGSTTSFQLSRPIGIGQDIVQNLNSSNPAIVFTPGYNFPTFSTPYGSQNFLAWSQDQSQSVYTRNQLGTPTITAAPDTGASAWTLTPTGGATNAFIQQSIGIPDLTLGTEFTFSLWLRANAGTPSVSVEIANQSGVSRGIITATLSTVWDKFVVSGTMVPGDTSLIVEIGGGNTWTSAVGAIDVAWFQLERGPTALAYILTASEPYTYTISSTGIVQFTTAPLPNAVLVWSGGFYYRVRFGDDDTTFDQQFDQIWNNGKITLMSVIL